MRSAALAGMLALAIATPAAAQRPMSRDTSHHPMAGHRMPAQPARQGMGGMQAGTMRCSMMQGGMMQDSAMGAVRGGMMGAMAGSAEHVLGDRASLHLSADQERRITAIRDAARTEHDAALREAEHHEQELADVMRAAAPDTNAMQAHFQGVQAAMGRAHLAMLRSAALTRAVLTDEQRRAVDSLAASPGCGMMGRGAWQAAHGH